MAARWKGDASTNETHHLCLLGDGGGSSLVGIEGERRKGVRKHGKQTRQVNTISNQLYLIAR